MWGWELVLLGIIGLILPVMPGWVFLIPGLIILSDYFAWARRLTEWAKKKANWAGRRSGAANKVSSRRSNGEYSGGSETRRTDPGDR